MPYAGMPTVRHGRLKLPQCTLRLDTPAWFAWLETATAFCYVGSHPIDRMTVRREKRRHSFYWFAYVKLDSKLHNAYLGKSHTLTQQKLEAFVSQLNRQAIAAATHYR